MVRHGSRLGRCILSRISPVQDVQQLLESVEDEDFAIQNSGKPSPNPKSDASLTTKIPPSQRRWPVLYDDRLRPHAPKVR